MRKFKQIICLLIYLSILFSCKKISDEQSNINENGKVKNGQNNNSIFARGGSTFSWTNQNLLSLVLSGEGGFIIVDSSCVSCTVDTLKRVEFPSYSPPINNGEMLVFASKTDYDLFI